MSGNDTKSQTGLNTIHKVQGRLLSRAITVEYEGKKIIVVSLNYASEYVSRAYGLGKQSKSELQFTTDSKVDKILARLHKLLDKHP